MKSSWVVVLLLAGCSRSLHGVDQGAPFDQGLADLGPPAEGPLPLRGVFTLIGCASLDAPQGQPRCRGQAPLTVTLVPLGTGLDSLLWTTPGGEPASSKELAPQVTFKTPGLYSITLAAGGPGGTTTAVGTILVTSGGAASPCWDDDDCDDGLYCICKPGDPNCPPALTSGFCARECGAAPCATGEICADLTRGGTAGDEADGGTTPLGWRRALCLPACAQSGSCRAGFTCRELPVLSPGQMPGGDYRWLRGCFALVGGDDGASCRNAAGQLDPSRCLSGQCEALGVRGLCTSPCATSSDCPATAACATFTGPPAQRRCVRRCADGFACEGDPLLDCEVANPRGGLGFELTPAEAPGAHFCAPRRCTQSSQCAPAGVCTQLPQGDAGGQFCLGPG